MAQDEGRDSKELGSAEDVRLERLLEDLHSTAMTLALSISAFRRRPDNPVYQASAEQQARLGHRQLRELLAVESVAYSEEAATAGVRAARELLELIRKLGSAAITSEFAELFGEAVAGFYDETRLASHGRPCETLGGLLADWAEIPAPPTEAEEQAAAAVAPPGEPAEPRVLFEQTFTHVEAGASKPWLGRLLLAFLEHVRGLSPDEAVSRLHPQALVGFDQSLQRSLGDHRGPVVFRIVQHGEQVPRIELRRLIAHEPE